MRNKGVRRSFFRYFNAPTIDAFCVDSPFRRRFLAGVVSTCWKYIARIPLFLPSFRERQIMRVSPLREKHSPDSCAMFTFSRRYEFPPADHIFRDPAAQFWKSPLLPGTGEYCVLQGDMDTILNARKMRAIHARCIWYHVSYMMRSCGGAIAPTSARNSVCGSSELEEFPAKGREYWDFWRCLQASFVSKWLFLKCDKRCGWRKSIWIW